MYIFAVVEGQTEEKFVKEVLSPFLEKHGKFITPYIVKTSIGHKGGITTYKHIKRDIVNLLRNPNYCVTTMIDYYGLPSDFPGKQNIPVGNIYQKVAHLESEFYRDIGNSRFIPYIQIHEFEALLFCDITKFNNGNIYQNLQKVVSKFSNPEEINDSPNTAPSKRIEKAYKEAGLIYNKLSGIDIIKEIGISLLVQKCSHFGQWVGKLTNIGVC